MADEYYSFDEALDELRLKEEELKRLVSEGEIRAFREGDTMKLRQSDVKALRDELSGGEVVDLGGVEEELVFEDEDLGEAGMATEEISTADTIIDDDVEDVGEIDLDDEEEVITAAPTRRSGARAAAVVEEEEVEGMGIRFALIATSLLLVVVLPVAYSIATGTMGELARPLASMFENKG
ncbi:MAG: helix-turn-helix domain-containing protein [Planctomycetes bacterium]|nr:helix-turn-helix domain-containing protein [Planctomycetota bacterium]MCB9905394.1 helix-turn-helix domain-containing protein [Planctomycetota bacterium]